MLSWSVEHSSVPRSPEYVRGHIYMACYWIEPVPMPGASTLFSGHLKSRVTQITQISAEGYIPYVVSNQVAIKTGMKLHTLKSSHAECRRAVRICNKGISSSRDDVLSWKLTDTVKVPLGGRQQPERILAYRHSSPGEVFATTKSACLVPLPYEVVSAWFRDWEHPGRKAANSLGSEVLEVFSDKHKVIWGAFTVGYGLEPRDMVINEFVIESSDPQAVELDGHSNSKRRLVVCWQSCQHLKKPILSGMVRMNVMFSCVMVEDHGPDATRVIVVNKVDVGLPSWFINATATGHGTGPIKRLLNHHFPVNSKVKQKDVVSLQERIAVLKGQRASATSSGENRVSESQIKKLRSELKEELRKEMREELRREMASSSTVIKEGDEAMPPLSPDLDRDSSRGRELALEVDDRSTSEESGHLSEVTMDNMGMSSGTPTGLSEMTMDNMDFNNSPRGRMGGVEMEKLHQGRLHDHGQSAGLYAGPAHSHVGRTAAGPGAEPGAGVGYHMLPPPDGGGGGGGEYGNRLYSVRGDLELERTNMIQRQLSDQSAASSLTDGGSYSVQSSFYTEQTEATSNQSLSEQGQFSTGFSEFSNPKNKRYRKVVRKLQAIGVFTNLRNELIRERLASRAMHQRRLPPALQMDVLEWHRTPSLSVADRGWIERWRRCRDMIHRHAAGHSDKPTEPFVSSGALC